jgi:outer membrane immunogenic protein
MRKFLVVTAAFLGLATSASAMDFNLGVQGGYGWSESDVNIPLYPSSFTLDSDGWILGGFAGVDWDMGSGWSLGLEADANWTDADGDHLSGGGPPGERYVIEQNWNASLRGRVGVDVAADTELFGALGLAWADIETSYNPLAGGTDGATLQGWTAGFGLERQFAGSFGHIEYRYYDYDSENFFHLGPSNADLSTHAVLFGLGWTL